MEWANDVRRSRGNRPLKIFLSLALFAVVAAISPTLASNISINSGGPSEFGQGLVATTTCDSYLEIAAKGAYAIDDFILESIEIRDISVLTHDNSLSLQIYSETSSVGLLASPAVIKVGSSGTSFTKTSSGDNTTLETVEINASQLGKGSKQEKGASIIRLTSITRDGVNPILAQDVKKFTLESFGEGTCSVVYSVGDVGPAGGTIGIVPTTAGNSTGRYFEFAPPLPSQYSWCGSGDFGLTNALGTGSAIGAGAANTVKIAANCTSGAGFELDRYLFGGYSDWFLPSAYELDAVKALGLAGSFASSTEFGGGSHYYQNLPTGQPVLNDHAPKTFSLKALPMRSFTLN